MKLDKVKGFLENQPQKELDYIEAFVRDDEQLSPLGEIAFLVYEFCSVKNDEDMTHFGAKVVRLTQEHKLHFVEGQDRFFKFVSHHGVFRVKRMSDNYKKGLDRIYFEGVSSKPHTTLINSMARNQNLGQFDFVTGTIDMLHYLDTDKSTGVWTSWMETENFVINPYFNLIMPRNEFYHLFDAHALNRIKGQDLKQDLADEKLRKVILSKNNEEYLLARKDFVAKFKAGQMGE